MNINKILIILGEPNSIFTEILFKYLKKRPLKSFNKKILLVGSKKLFSKQMKKLNYKFNINLIKNVNESKIHKINLINVNYNFKKEFTKISHKSNDYLNDCFNLAINILKKNKDIALLNGPISKKNFLKKKYYGVTEYIADKSNSKNQVMLIYNKKFSVSPITTHIPIKYVAKSITKKKIINNALKINYFYKKFLKIRPKIAILGLNPHCETTDKVSEETKIIGPSIKFLKKNKINIEGPFSADTFFLSKNLKKYNVAIGMYHDQVLTPLKTLYNFNAINITLGLPFIRISPDHGPNYEMIGKNKSDPSSMFCAMEFFLKI